MELPVNIYHLSLGAELGNFLNKNLNLNLNLSQLENLKLRLAFWFAKNNVTFQGYIKQDLNAESFHISLEIIKTLIKDIAGSEPAIENILPLIVKYRMRKSQLKVEKQQIYEEILKNKEGKKLLNFLKQNYHRVKKYEKEVREIELEEIDINNPENIVVVVNNQKMDKFQQLDELIKKSLFFEDLENCWKKSGKEKDEFKIVIKPNLTMLARKYDDGVYTDPTLVIHLIRRVMEQGFSNISIADAQNIYGNWFAHREVVKVAARSGYLDEEKIEEMNPSQTYQGTVFVNGEEKKYKIIDLTLDRQIYDYGEEAGQHEISKTWVEADYRISFAKNKTHFVGLYTLNLKNIYGSLPHQNKMRHYHHKHLTYQLTAHQLKHFPVNFCFVDGYTSADWIFGAKMKAVSLKTKTMFGGKSILAVDQVGAMMMGLDPFVSPFFEKAFLLLGGIKRFHLSGKPELYPKWKNSIKLAHIITSIFEYLYHAMAFLGHMYTSEVDRCFPDMHLWRTRFLRVLLILPYPVMLILNLDKLKLYIAEILCRKLVKNNKQKLPLSFKDKDFYHLIKNFTLENLLDLEKALSSISNKSDFQNLEIKRSGHQIKIVKKVINFVSTTPFIAEYVLQILKKIIENKWTDREVLNDLEGWIEIHKNMKEKGSDKGLFFARQNM